MVEYLNLFTSNSAISHQGNNLIKFCELSSSPPLPLRRSRPRVTSITPTGLLFPCIFIRIFCDVLVLSLEVLFQGTRLWVAMINSLRTSTMSRLALLTTWKRSRRKQEKLMISSQQTYSSSTFPPDSSLHLQTSQSSSSEMPCTVARKSLRLARALQLVVYLLLVDKFRMLSCVPIPRPSVTSSSVVRMNMFIISAFSLIKLPYTMLIHLFLLFPSGIQTIKFIAHPIMNFLSITQLFVMRTSLVKWVIIPNCYWVHKTHQLCLTLVNICKIIIKIHMYFNITIQNGHYVLVSHYCSLNAEGYHFRC